MYIYIKLFLLTCILLLMAGSNVLKAQTRATKNSLGFYWGFHSARSQDLVFSPMIYRGSAARNLGLRYTRRTGRGQHRLDLTYTGMEMTSTDPIDLQLFGGIQQRQPSEAFEVNIRYGYLRELNSAAKFRLSLGGLLEARFYQTNYRFALSEADGYILANSIKPWLAAELQVGARNSVRAEFHFPVRLPVFTGRRSTTRNGFAEAV